MPRWMKTTSTDKVSKKKESCRYGLDTKKRLQKMKIAYKIVAESANTIWIQTNRIQTKARLLRSMTCYRSFHFLLRLKRQRSQQQTLAGLLKLGGSWCNTIFLMIQVA
jgi:hypothetical protein